jgi:hypothetical protein
MGTKLQSVGSPALQLDRVGRGARRLGDITRTSAKGDADVAAL